MTCLETITLLIYQAIENICIFSLVEAESCSTLYSEPHHQIVELKNAAQIRVAVLSGDILNLNLDL